MLAEKSEISRGRLRRLEGQELERATYGELKKISSALGLEVGELFQERIFLANEPYLGKAGQKVFQFEGTCFGTKIFSLLPPRPDLFWGKLFVPPQKQLSATEVPRAETIFFQMLLGTFVIDVSGKTYEIHSGDYLIFRPGDSPYTLKNPLPRESVAFLLTLPSFSF